MYTMNESVAVAKEADMKKGFSPTKSSDSSIQRLRDEPERQIGSLRGVIGNIRRDGGTPSVESIATELSSMHNAERAPALLALQQTHGNRYVQRVVAGIQAKLVVGQTGDKYEQEADRVAEQVLRMPERQVRRLREEEELIMAKGISGKAPEVSDNLQARLNQSKGGGQPLPAETMFFMENRFGVDFSPVRIHADSEAAQMARGLNAEAFTYGRDIYFGAGRYAQGILSGKKLLAHELTHVVQQGQKDESIPWHIHFVQTPSTLTIQKEASIPQLIQLLPIRQAFQPTPCERVGRQLARLILEVDEVELRILSHNEFIEEGEQVERSPRAERDWYSTVLERRRRIAWQERRRTQLQQEEQALRREYREVCGYDFPPRRPPT